MYGNYVAKVPERHIRFGLLFLLNKSKHPQVFFLTVQGILMAPASSGVLLRLHYYYFYYYDING